MGEIWDAVVVGGGPAGSALAARLAEKGAGVLLLDREEFPRPKPCGECINPAGVGALAALGVLPRLQAAAPARLTGWRIVQEGGSAFAGAFPQGEAGMALPRAVLDALLLEHARSRGAVVRMGVRVADLLYDGSRVSGVRVRSASRTPETIRARLVVGADGLRSVVSRRIGLLKRQPRLRKVALTAHLHSTTPMAGTGEMHVLPWGCIGVAQVGPDTVNVTVVAAGDEVRRVAGDRDGYFDRSVRKLPRLAGAERLDDVLATGPFDWPTRSAVADGALLVGDAAGYYDPFTGQGIFRALRSAELAAETAERALGAGDASASALAPYDRAQRRAFAPGVRVQHLIEAVVSSPRLFRAASARLARHTALADALIAVTADLRPVRSLFHPRLLASWVI